MPVVCFDNMAHCWAVEPELSARAGCLEVVASCHTLLRAVALRKALQVLQLQH